MAKKMLIDATHAEETRVVVVDGNKVEEFDFESENKRQLAGNIYLAKVTRVEPSLQAAFIDYGGNRHGFLAFSEIHPDYYQIPVADREALLAEERAYAEAQAAEEEEREKRGKSSRSRSRGRSRSRAKSKAEDTVSDDAVTAKEASIGSLDVVDLDTDAPDQASGSAIEEGTSPAFTVAETPVETPAAGQNGNGNGNGDAPAATPVAGADAADENTDASGDHDDEHHDHHDDHHDDARAPDATEKDETIESVAEEDVTEEIRQPRKPRPRKYKIQEVVKVRQILLVQVVKEERGNKGAALTTYLSLAGRYCVLMPNTARGGGISRKITNAADRKKLKEIAGGIEVPQGAGLIIRTAGAQRTKTEIKRDYEYLQRMWEQIRELTLKSIAPAKIYEEGNLIKRSIRDLYNREIDEVFVEGEGGYRVAKDFMKMIMPSHAKNVKLYHEPMPLFARFQVESYLGSMFNPTVQLKSGGYIVIGVTEALVAIDVNSGRATKESSIEETALKTNLEASDEVARQLRLRDLAGLIVIDYIDMEERRNNSAVEKRFKDRLKNDRARIQVGRISGFGLLEMSRQRLRPGMIEATTQPCNHCHGTGLIRSDDNLALSILRQLEEEGVRKRSREVLVKAPVGIANYLVNQKREHIAGIEATYGIAVRVESDPFLISPDFSIEKFKTATRVVREVSLPVVSVDASLMADVDEDDEVEEVAVATPAPTLEASDEAPAPKKRRRRRRRRRSSGQGGDGQAQEGAQDGSQQQAAGAEASVRPAGGDASDGDAPVEAAPQPQPESVAPVAQASAQASADEVAVDVADVAVDAAPAADVGADEAAVKPAKKVTRKRPSRAKKPAKAASDAEVDAETTDPEAPKPKAKRSRAKPKKASPTEVAETEAAGADAAGADAAGADATAPVAAEAEAEAEKPKKKAPRKRASRAKATPKPAPDVAPQSAPDSAPEAAPESVPESVAVAEVPEPVATPAAPEPVAAAAPQSVPAPAVVSVEPAKPKKKGWWSLGK
jgi:ribonuclease E